MSRRSRRQFRDRVAHSERTVRPAADVVDITDVCLSGRWTVYTETSRVTRTCRLTARFRRAINTGERYSPGLARAAPPLRAGVTRRWRRGTRAATDAGAAPLVGAGIAPQGFLGLRFRFLLGLTGRGIRVRTDADADLVLVFLLGRVHRLRTGKVETERGQQGEGNTTGTAGGEDVGEGIEG